MMRFHKRRSTWSSLLGVSLWLAAWPAWGGDPGAITREDAAREVASRLQSALDLDAALNGYRTWLKVEHLSVPRPIALPGSVPAAKPAAWRVQVTPAMLAAGRQEIPFAVLVDGEEAAAMQATAVLRRWVKVPVLAATVRRGTVIDENHLDWQHVDFKDALDGRRNQFLVQDPEQILGQVAQRTIRAGQTLQSRWFKPPVAIKRGEKVTVTLREGGLRIRAMGIAMDQGGIGEDITVRNPDSNRQFLARVLSPGQVQVSLY